MKNRTNSVRENPLKNIAALQEIQSQNMEDRIIKERELSDLIINCLPGIFYLQDQTGKYIRWNRNFEIVSGYSREEIEKMHPLDFFDKDDHEQMNAATRKVYKEGYNETEAEIVTKNGRRLLYYLNGISVNYEGKLCLLGAGLDLTAREAARKKIRESDDKYRSLFEQATDAILVTDFDSNIKDANSSFCKLLGYTKKELLRMNVRTLVCPQQLRERPLQIDLLMKGKHLFHERLMIHKNGSILETEANLKKFGEDRFLGVVRDVTTIRKIQRELEQERIE